MRPQTVADHIRRRMGVRMRSALAAGLVVAVASVLAGVVLLITAHGILMDNITTAANDRLTQVMSDVRANQAISSPASDRSVVQVLDASGTVVDASSSISGAAPI